MAPAAAVGEIDVDDPTAYEANSQPWEIMATPVETRTFGHRNTYLVTPSVILYRESFDSRLRVQVLTPAGMFGFTIPIWLGSRSRYWESPYSASGLPASMPGALDAVIDAGQPHLIVLISLDHAGNTVGIARLRPRLRGLKAPAAGSARGRASPGSVIARGAGGRAAKTACVAPR
jgi:hypothetical protein